MGDRLSQHDRLFRFDSPLGEDKFVVRSLEGTEEMSSLFQFRVELASEDPFVDETALLGKAVTLAVRQADGKTFRHFNGRVSRFRYAGPEGSFTLYRAEVVPWTWLLTQTADCNVRQGKSVPKMVEETFRRYGFSNNDFERILRHEKRYGPWEFSAQYRESSFDYAARLLEAEGIFYFYRQEPGGHKMVMADDNSACEPCPYQSKFRMDRVRGPGVNRVYDTVFTFDLQRQVRPGRYAHRDFNFLRPDPRQLHAEAEGRSRVEESRKLEIYDYPGEYEEPPEGRDWVQLRIEEEETPEEIFEGTSNARSLIPGFRFDLSGHERREWNRSYLITKMEHSGEEANLEPGLPAVRPRYDNRFRCIPASTQYKPERKTATHLMQGPQTAIVVGPKDEEIYTDPHGRVRVKFHWDRSDNKGDDCSAWIRVAQLWAGANWGAMFLPRVGQEIIVDFLEGDPDRPIITGRVYNADRMPAWPLPSKKNISGIRTRSTKGGGPKNYNEISFDDTKGEELFALHAEKDFRLTVENDQTDIIDRDRFVTIKRDHIEVVKRNRHRSVDGDASNKVEGTLDEETGKQHTEKVGGSRHTDIGGDWFTRVGGRVSLEFGSGAAAHSGGTLMLHTGEGLFAKDDSKVLVEAGGELTLKGPGGFITINGGGIYLQGSMIYLNSGGSAVSYPGAPAVDVDKPKAPERPPGFEAPAPFVSPAVSPLPGMPSRPGMPALPSSGLPNLDSLSSIAAAAQQRLPELPASMQAAVRDNLAKLSQWKQAAELAPLASASYSDTGAPPGWTRLAEEKLPEALRNSVFSDPRSGFSASLFQSAEGVVLAFRGTDDVADWTDANLPQSQGRASTQYAQALLLAHAVQDAYGANVRLTGHSLGGGLASAAARMTGLRAQVFNSSGLHQDTVSRFNEARPGPDPVTNHFVKGEILTTAQTLTPLPNAVGRQIPLPAVDEKGQPAGWLSDLTGLKRHGMTYVDNGLAHERDRLLRELGGVL